MKNENFDICKSVALELEAYANGDYYRCPECGAVICFDNDQYNGESAEYTCQECGATFEESNLEALSVWDYFADALHIEYYSTGRGPEDYTGVRVMVACGGPNIYVDTKRGKVELFWWNEYACFELWRSTCDAIDEAFSEMWCCL